MGTRVLECSMDRSAGVTLSCPQAQGFQISHQSSIPGAALDCWEMSQELATLEGAAGAARMGGAAVRRSLTRESLWRGLFQGFMGILHPFSGICDCHLSGSLLMGLSEPQRLLRL